jgi:hypothetical protein
MSLLKWQNQNTCSLARYRNCKSRKKEKYCTHTLLKSIQSPEQKEKEMLYTYTAELDSVSRSERQRNVERTPLNKIQSSEQKDRNHSKQIKTKQNKSNHQNPKKSQSPTQIATAPKEERKHPRKHNTAQSSSSRTPHLNSAVHHVRIGIKKEIHTNKHPSLKSPNQLLTPYAQPPRSAASPRHACQSSPYSRAKRRHVRRRARLWCPVLERKC